MSIQHDTYTHICRTILDFFGLVDLPFPQQPRGQCDVQNTYAGAFVCNAGDNMHRVHQMGVSEPYTGSQKEAL